MDTVRFIATVGAGLLATATADVAHAAPAAFVMPQLFAQSFFPTSADCSATTSGLTVTGDLAVSKSSAILGGQVSRLDMIAIQQSGTAVALQPAAMRTQSETLGLEPALPCAAGLGTRLQTPTSNIGGRSTGEPGSFLGSRLVAIAHSPFDRQWARVSRDGLDRRFARKVVGEAGSGSNLALLASVNAWANSHIRYVADDSNYRTADYWAKARSTLRRGAGDCEDIAIVKLHLLAALGMDRSNLYLTVARDLARNADHAMLIVKLEGRTWLLDNSTAKVLDASQNYDYRPIISYNASQRWLHGY